MNETRKFSFDHDPYEQFVKQILANVYETLQQAGYDPIPQISGYLLTGDSVYIPRDNGAREKVQQIEREELLEELLRHFMIKYLE